MTWLRNTSLAATSGFAAGGLMNFPTAQAWAARLDVDGIIGGRIANVGVPDTACSDPGTSTGSGCVGGALGHMYNMTMDGIAGTGISPNHNDNTII
jgi:hypothetical protein